MAATEGMVPGGEETAERAALLERIRRLERASRPLEPGAGRRRRMRNAVVASTERFLRGVDTLKAYEAGAGTGEGLLGMAIGERGAEMDEVVALLEQEVTRPGGHPASPGHLAYIPGGGLYHSALADFMAAVTNKYAGIFFTGPGPVRMENQLVRWVADLVGYPADAAGTTVSGGSLATLTAVATARDAHGLRGADYASTVVYLTTEAHHAVDKALRIAGLGEARLRYVPTDEGLRMRPDALAALVAEDRAAGLRPWLIAAAAGTTATGAVDPLDAIADVAEREGCWLHVDAAYGGFFLLTEHGRAMMKGIERSDSVILDPHKSLFLPWGSGMVLVRDARAMAAAHGGTGSYMQDALRADPGEISPADVSPELSRPFRALRMWLPLVLVGVGPFRAALEEKLLLARYFRAEARALGFEVGPEPDLSIVTFRWAPAGMDPERVHALNEALVEAMRHDGRVFLSSVTVDGRFTLRMAALSFRTHRRTIDLALRLLREHVERLRA
ncbi:pyridoxal phosphate-dependent decarboxylase family protein [Longimicrobium sp.]|uniref:pyridoxal phosphate-dependent decarboxylase family protein n=1 Tax=Longimicrobium sp. TaxID=2029185 RepID=UPI002E2F987D|nr:aminotransferase class V-fold PLP-dependent enzyme [Longimicrobium sp.]HEX6036956.1 aminotransferase class V-fold PLP-dependent enzyme [Longimicrobium sp.]